MAQPLNTWSSLAYLLVGLAAICSAPRWSANELFGPSIFLLGVGSILFHASVTTEMQWADVAGMYLVLVALMARAARQLWPIPGAWQLCAILLADVVLATIASRNHGEVGILWLKAEWLVPILGTITGLLALRVARRYQRSPYILLCACVLLGAGYALHTADQRRQLSVGLAIYGHATWHVLTAAALYIVYRFLQPASRTPS